MKIRMGVRLSALALGLAAATSVQLAYAEENLEPIAGSEAPAPVPEAAPETSVSVPEPAQPEPPKQDEATAPTAPPAEASTVASKDPRIARYTFYRPHWAVQFTGSLHAMGKSDLQPQQAGLATRAVSMYFEYQPDIVQSYGILGLGPSFAIYPVDRSANITNRNTAIWSAGVQVQYQARYFRSQPLVPTIGYAYEYLNYQFVNGPTGHLSSKGPVLGINLLLNVFDPGSAANFYANAKVMRSYLVGEVRNLAGSSKDTSFSGNSVYFGFRLEL